MTLILVLLQIFGLEHTEGKDTSINVIIWMLLVVLVAGGKKVSYSMTMLLVAVIFIGQAPMVQATSTEFPKSTATTAEGAIGLPLSP